MRVRRATTDFRRSAERKNHVQRDTEKKLLRLLYRYGKTGRGVVYRKSPLPPPSRHTEHKYQSPLSNFPRKKNWKNKRKKRNPPLSSFPFFVLLRWCERTPGIFPPISLPLRYSVAAARNLIYSPNYYTEFFPENAARKKKTENTDGPFAQMRHFFQFLLR